MRFFLDTEFNGFGGELISMALVSEDGEHVWYQVRTMILGPTPWVAEHVMPKLVKKPINAFEFRKSFYGFIKHFDGCEIIADWPSDFEHFCSLLTTIGADNGYFLPIECNLRLVKGDGTIKPENPHNALSDAHALREWFLTREHAAS